MVYVTPFGRSILRAGEHERKSATYRNCRRRASGAWPPVAGGAVMLALVGPTAIGKTALSLEIAREFGCEIISMDSMQVYRGMDIGTAKATPEERALVPHHLLDIVNPDEPYNAARFVRDCRAAMADIRNRGKIPLITGGTGLYLRALNEGLFEVPAADPVIREGLRKRLAEEGRAALHAELAALDPASAARIHVNDTQRLLRALEIHAATGEPWSAHLARQKRAGGQGRAPRLLIGLTCERALLYERIDRRTARMMGEPFRREVAGLLAAGYGPELPAMQSLGYRHMLRQMAGDWPPDTARDMLARDTRHYAKRQLTWFRREADIRWFDREDADGVLRLAARFVEGKSTS